VIELFVYIILFCALSAIVFQDFKFREIHAGLLGVVFSSGILLLFLKNFSFTTMLTTFIFLFLVLTLLWAYLSVKQKKVINPLQRHIGLGDVLFFFAITPFFSLHSYMIFFISGMIVTIVYALVFIRKHERFIPLAGILSCYLIGLKVLSFFIKEDLFYLHNYSYDILA